MLAEEHEWKMEKEFQLAQEHKKKIKEEAAKTARQAEENNK